MSTAKEIVNAIEKAFREKSFDSHDSAVRVGRSGHYVFEWKSNEVSVKGELLQEDSIGVMMNSLIVEKDIGEDKEISAYLKGVADAIEKRVTYLMEPLKVIEIDSTSNAVQIRSEKPEMREGFLSYFELILKSGKWFGHRDHVSLCRHSHRPEAEKRRRKVAFPLTKVQLERLLSDLIEIL